MGAAPFLEDREGLADLAGILEVAEEQYGVGEVADVDRGLHGADEAVLGQGKDGGDALLAEVGEQFVELHGEELFMRHGVEEAVHAVQDEHAQVFVLDQPADPGDKFSRGEFRGVDLLDLQCAVVEKGLGSPFRVLGRVR